MQTDGRARTHETKPIDCFLQRLRDTYTVRRARKNSRADAFSATICRGLPLCGRDIRNMPTSRASYRVARLIRPPMAPSEGGHEIRLSPRSSSRVTPMEFHRESRPARIVTRSQFVCPRIRTYVGHVIHGIVHAMNPRYQKMPRGCTVLYTGGGRAELVCLQCTRARLSLCPTTVSTHVRSMGYLEMETVGIM